MNNDIFNSVADVFNETANVCNGVGRVAQTAQQMVSSFQDLSRRNMGWDNNCQTQTTNMYPSEPPITFTPYPGFWNEDYGK